MTKLCSACGTENREEAQFCRACGTAFAAAISRNAASDGGAALNACEECGFQNKPGLRYCANCGMTLASASADAEGDAGFSEGDAASGLGPPPISYPSFAPVGPYPPAPPGDHGAPDIPDPDAALALRQQEAEETFHAATPFSNAAAPNRALFYIGIVALVLIVGGVLAWTFMRASNPSPPAIGATTPPVAPAVPAASAVPTPPVVVEAAPTSSPAAVVTSASAVETPPAAPPPTSTGALGTPPAAAQPLPQVGDPASPEEAEAKRVAAERRRERAAREKAEREAKALAEQRDQSAAAAQRAEQEAQARKRAEEAQRARATAAVPPPPAPVVAQPRGVREICAGRGTIAEAVCQSRQCGLAEHANEAICRQLREQDERRRNYNN